MPLDAVSASRELDNNAWCCNRRNTSFLVFRNGNEVEERILRRIFRSEWANLPQVDLRPYNLFVRGGVTVIIKTYLGVRL